MPSPTQVSPHLAHGRCFRCEDDASKYNHCSWCGGDFGSHHELKDHWLKTSCGQSLFLYLHDIPGAKGR